MEKEEAKSMGSDEESLIRSYVVVPTGYVKTEAGEEISEVEAASSDSSQTLVSTVEASNVPVNEGEQDAASSDESTSTLTAASFTGSGNSSPVKRNGNICEGSVEGKAELAVSSFPSAAESTEGGKTEAESGSCTAKTVTAIYAAEVGDIEWKRAEDEPAQATDMLPCASRDEDGKEATADIRLASGTFEEAVTVSPLPIVSSVQSCTLADVPQPAIPKIFEGSKREKVVICPISCRPVITATVPSATTHRIEVKNMTSERRTEGESSKRDEIKPLVASSSNIRRRGKISRKRISLSNDSDDSQASSERASVWNVKNEFCFCKIYLKMVGCLFLVIFFFIFVACYALDDETCSMAWQPIIGIGLLVMFLLSVLVGVKIDEYSKRNYPNQPLIGAFEIGMSSEAESAMAMNRAANPRLYYDYCPQSSRIFAMFSEGVNPETQAAGVSDTTESQQTEASTLLGVPGPSGLCGTSQSLKKGLTEVLEMASMSKDDGSTDSVTDVQSSKEQVLEMASMSKDNGSTDSVINVQSSKEQVLEMASISKDDGSIDSVRDVQSSKEQVLEMASMSKNDGSTDSVTDVQSSEEQDAGKTNDSEISTDTALPSPCSPVERSQISQIIEELRYSDTTPLLKKKNK